MITSTGNGRIRELVKLKKSAKERMARGVFIVEGPKMFREIPRGMCLEAYASESFSLTDEGRDMLESARMKPAGPEVVSDQVFQYISDTRTPQGILAVVKMPVHEMRDLTGGVPLIIVLENLQDPGNLGTILRTAEAAGASGILLSQGCADLYNPKVTRSTMGSIFRVPFVYTQDLKGAIVQMKECGVRILAAHLKGSVDLYEESLTGPTAILIGNESRGLTDETAALANQAIRIPMSGRVESLNAAVATAVCLFEAKRQRRIRTEK